MNIYKKILLILLLSLFITFLSRASFVDSLLNGKSDTTQIRILENLINRSDSLPIRIYARDKLISLYSKTQNKHKWFFAYLSQIDDYKNIDFSKVIKTGNFLENELKKEKNDTLLSELYKKLGILYEQKNNYEKAGLYYLKSLKLKRKLNDYKGIASALNSLGLIYYYQGNYKLALKNYKEALKYIKKVRFKPGILSILNNMGNIYLYEHKLDTAISVYNKALKIENELKDKHGLSGTYNNLAIIYQKQKKYNKALLYFNQVLQIKKEINDTYGITFSYINIASLLIEKKQYNQALMYLNKAKKIAKDKGYLELLKNIYNNYAIIYSNLNDYKKAFEYKNKFVEIKDSLINEKMQEQLMALQTKYETEQKEQQIALQKAKLEKIEAQNKQQELKLAKERLLRIVFSIGFLILVVGIIFVYNNYRQKRKLSEELSRQNYVIQHKNKRLNELIEEIEEQRAQLEIIHNELSESIDYAKRLQASILPDFNILSKNLTDFFVLFKPKDKVSGDFFWWTHFDAHTIISVADCTGHGVPGAFMSMLGMSFLREIVEKEQIINPDKILNKLREEIIKALKQRGIEGEQKDGMDMTIVAINHNTNEIEFAGANNPIYLLRNNPLTDINNITTKIKTLTKEEGIYKYFYEFKPDKMPVAIYEKMDSFSAHKIKTEKTDIIYLFSDGYADQFGGTNNKKFKSKNFKELIIKIADLPMTSQKEILDKTLEEWKNGYPQTDDITVMGIKI